MRLPAEEEDILDVRRGDRSRCKARGSGPRDRDRPGRPSPVGSRRKWKRRWVWIKAIPGPSKVGEEVYAGNAGTCGITFGEAIREALAEEMSRDRHRAAGGTWRRQAHVQGVKGSSRSSVRKA